MTRVFGEADSDGVKFGQFRAAHLLCSVAGLFGHWMAELDPTETPLMFCLQRNQADIQAMAQ